MNIHHTVLRTFVLGAVAYTALLAQNYTFQVVECGEYTAFPYSINNAGTIVGAAHNINSALSRGFIYSNGSCGTTLLGTRGTTFLGINNQNQVMALYTQT